MPVYGHYFSRNDDRNFEEEGGRTGRWFLGIREYRCDLEILVPSRGVISLIQKTHADLTNQNDFSGGFWGGGWKSRNGGEFQGYYYRGFDIIAEDWDI